MKPILIAVAPYYREITDQLVAGATGALGAAGFSVEVVEAPGAFEIPGIVALAAQTGKYAGYVALGCVIRGETTHYDYVCGESARGLQDLAVHARLAIGYGILTCETREQAQVRADVQDGNKGREAAEACMRMMEYQQRFAV